MKSLAVALIAAVLLAFAAGSSFAQDVPALSLQRLNIGAGANYDWLSNAEQGAPALPFDREWSAGLYAAYNLIAPPVGQKGTRLSLIGSSEYLMDNKIFFSKIGLRVTIFNGSTR